MARGRPAVRWIAVAMVALVASSCGDDDAGQDALPTEEPAGTVASSTAETSAATEPTTEATTPATEPTTETTGPPSTEPAGGDLAAAFGPSSIQ